MAMEKISVRLTPGQLTLMNELMERFGTTQSALIRMMITDFSIRNRDALTRLTDGGEWLRRNIRRCAGKPTTQWAGGGFANNILVNTPYARNAGTTKESSIRERLSILCIYTTSKALFPLQESIWICYLMTAILWLYAANVMGWFITTPRRLTRCWWTSWIHCSRWTK